MDPNSDNRFTPDIQRALGQHDQVLRLSYMEIASGINRLLRSGIPKEVVAQVLNQAVEALANEVPHQP
ncbi:MAG: hypothetical protein M3P45_09475 [Acidobacteriota bacterium]|nr:hypothetical protein [Acidobacteriota bacterium]